MNRVVAPDGIAPPAAAYAHAVLSEGPRRILHTSGIVPAAPDGTVPAGIGPQARQVWETLGLILEEAGMRPADVVSVVTYAVAGENLTEVMAARDEALGGHLAASTLVTVPALARPEWLVEVAVVAAS